MSHLEQFDQALLTMSQISENFLSNLRRSCLVDVTDLEAAISTLMVRYLFCSALITTIVLIGISFYAIVLKIKTFC